MKWISVEERLPEDGVEVLVFENKGVNLAMYSEEWEEWQAMYSYDVTNVTHWMPLPEPPKGE